MTSEQVLIVASGIMLMMGIGLFAAGIYTWHYYKIGKKKKCSAETIGTVVDQVGSTDRLYPVIEFQANGKVYRKRNLASITKQKFGSIYVSNGYEKGQRITVYYDPDKPSRWMINDSKEQMVLPIVFLPGGVIFIGISILFFFMV